MASAKKRTQPRAAMRSPPPVGRKSDATAMTRM